MSSIWQSSELYYGKTAIGQNFIAVNGQILNNNLSIWSHCLQSILSVPQTYVHTSELFGRMSYCREYSLTCKGKYHCTADLLFEYLEFDLTSKAVANSK